MSNQMKRKWIKGEFVGTPQWTLDKMYISPFTSQRRYDEDGVEHYDDIERNLHPTGIDVMDHYLRWLEEGKNDVAAFCQIYGIRTEDLNSFVFILTGMTSPAFSRAYQLRMADELLRYTDMTIPAVARRSGLGSHTNFCVIIQRFYKQTPSKRRKSLRKKGDEGRFRV